MYRGGKKKKSSGGHKVISYHIYKNKFSLASVREHLLEFFFLRALPELPLPPAWFRSKMGIFNHWIQGGSAPLKCYTRVKPGRRVITVVQRLGFLNERG